MARGLAVLVSGLGVVVVAIMAVLGWFVLQAPADLVNRALPSGLTLTLDPGGDVDIRWGRTSTLTITRGTLRDAAGLPVAQAERLRLSVDLVRLADGVVYVRDLEFLRGGVDLPAIIEALERDPDIETRAQTSGPAVLIELLALEDLVVELPGAVNDEIGTLVLDRMVIDGDPADPDRLRVGGDLELLGREVSLSGTLAHPELLFAPEPALLPIRLTVLSGADALEIEGTVSKGREGVDIDALARIDIADLGPVLRDIAMPVPDRFGLAGSVRLLGSLAAPGLRDIALVAGNGQDLVVDVTGAFADPLSAAGLDVTVSLDLPESFDLATILPVPGTLGGGNVIELDARLAGDSSTLTVTDLRAAMRRAEGEGTLTGAALSVTFPADEGPRLLAASGEASLRLQDPAALAIAFDLPVPDLDALALTGRIGLVADRLAFTVAAAEIAIADLALTGQGSASARLTDKGLEPDNFDLTISGQGTGRAALARLGLEGAPIRAPYTLRGRAAGTPERFALSDLVLEAGGARGLSIVLRGAISDLTAELDMADARAHLLLSASAPDLASFGRLAGIALPRFGETRLEAFLQGPANAPEIGHVRMIAGDSEGGSWILAFGRIARVALGEGEAPSGIDLTMLGAVRDIDTLRGLLPPDLANLPPSEAMPLRLQGVLSDADGPLGLRDLVITAGEPDGPGPRLLLDGSVGKLADLSNIALTGWVDLDLEQMAFANGLMAGPAEASVAGGEPWARQSLPVRGTFAVAERGGRPSLTNLALSTPPGAAETLRIEGGMADLTDPESLSGRVIYAAPTPWRLIALTGLELPESLPLSADIAFRPAAPALGAGGRITLGGSDATLDLTLDLDTSRPRLAGAIRSDLVRLSDLGLEVEAAPPVSSLDDIKPPTPSSRRPPAQARARETPVFSRDRLDLTALRRLDLAIEQRIARLEGREFAVREAQASIGLEDGRLHLRDMRATYEGGRGSAALLLDTRDGPFRFELDLRIDDMHLERLLAQVTDRASITGLSDIAMSLRGQGDTPLALAQTLSGDVTLAIGQGSINTSTARLMTQNLLGWLFTGGALSGNVRMDCAMMRANVRDGVASLDRLAVVLEDTVALGEGTIDIPQGWLDLTLVPRSRRGIGGTPTPVAARGPWENPSVGPSGAAIPLKLAGDVLLAPLQLLGTLLPFIGGETEHPCVGPRAPG